MPSVNTSPDTCRPRYHHKECSYRPELGRGGAGWGGARVDRKWKYIFPTSLDPGLASPESAESVWTLALMDKSESE